tara:strand:- start:1666 stop:1989 length:324 start_codon:yes stop_codon:yes gene_type:complete
MATWKIQQTNYVLSEDGLTDVINNLHWSLVETETVGEDVYTASACGTQGLGPPNPANYVPYADVTESECIAWCKGQMGEASVAALEASLADQIELQKNPIDGSGTPW